MPQIICEKLSVGYNGRKIQDNISFSVEEGEYLCIIGENGAGKSTLMRTMLGLQPPVSGRVEFCSGSAHEQIGYLPQQTSIQKDFPASVKEIVLSGCQNRCGLRPFYNRKEKQIAVEMMEKLQISDLSRRCYRELSGGQQQRVLLARALCAAQKILFLDEPVSGLDPKATEEMYDLIQKLNHDDGITIIMISHDMRAAENYASHILYIGDPVFCGTRDEYMKSEIYGKLNNTNLNGISGGRDD